MGMKQQVEANQQNIAAAFAKSKSKNSQTSAKLNQLELDANSSNILTMAIAEFIHFASLPFSLADDFHFK